MVEFVPYVEHNYALHFLQWGTILWQEAFQIATGVRTDLSVGFTQCFEAVVPRSSETPPGTRMLQCTIYRNRDRASTGLGDTSWVCPLSRRGSIACVSGPRPAGDCLLRARLFAADLEQTSDIVTPQFQFSSEYGWKVGPTTVLSSAGTPGARLCYAPTLKRVTAVCIRIFGPASQLRFGAIRFHH